MLVIISHAMGVDIARSILRKLPRFAIVYKKAIRFLILFDRN